VAWAVLPAPWAAALEAPRSAAWIVFLTLLLVPAGLPARRWLAAVAVLAALQLALGELTVDLTAMAPALPSLGTEAAAEAVAAAVAVPAPPIDLAVLAGITVRLLLAVLGILLVEQLYRHTPPRERWGIKFACLGLGTLFV
jgi:hypothetical protein